MVTSECLCGADGGSVAIKCLYSVWGCQRAGPTSGAGIAGVRVDAGSKVRSDGSRVHRPCPEGSCPKDGSKRSPVWDMPGVHGWPCFLSGWATTHLGPVRCGHDDRPSSHIPGVLLPVGGRVHVVLVGGDGDPHPGMNPSTRATAEPVPFPEFRPNRNRVGRAPPSGSIPAPGSIPPCWQKWSRCRHRAGLPGAGVPADPSG